MAPVRVRLFELRLKALLFGGVLRLRAGRTGVAWSYGLEVLKKKLQSWYPLKIFQVVDIPPIFWCPQVEQTLGISTTQPLGACEFSWNISQGAVNSHDFTIGFIGNSPDWTWFISPPWNEAQLDQQMDSKMVVKYRAFVPPSWFLFFWPCKLFFLVSNTLCIYIYLYILIMLFYMFVFS